MSAIIHAAAPPLLPPLLLPVLPNVGAAPHLRSAYGPRAEISWIDEQLLGLTERIVAGKKVITAVNMAGCGSPGRANSTRRKKACQHIARGSHHPAQNLSTEVSLGRGDTRIRSRRPSLGQNTFSSRPHSLSGRAPLEIDQSLEAAVELRDLHCAHLCRPSTRVIFP